LQFMIKRRHVLVFLLVFLVTPPAAPRAQNEDVLTRKNDDRAATIQQRQLALTILLAAAQQERTVDPAKAAAFLNRAARLQVRLNLSEQALTTYQQAFTLVEQTPNLPVKVDLLNGLAAAYGHLSRCDQAQTYLDQALALSEQKNNVAGKAEALFTRSHCQSYGDPVLAQETAQTALELWRSIDDKSWMALTYSYLSDFQIAQHKLVEATESNQAALAIWRQLDLPEEQAEALISLGFIEHRKGAMQEALAFFGQAQTLLDEEAEPYKMGQITGGMGEAFVEIGLPETGLDKFKLALEYYRKAESPRAAMVISWDIGKAYYLLGNYPEALATLQTTLADAAAINELTIKAMCHDFLGRTYQELDQQSAALDHFQLAMQLYTQVGKRREAARVLALIAQVELQQGKFDNAQTNYRSALATFRSLSDSVNESAVLYALGSQALHDDKIDLAEEFLRQSIDVTENIRRVSTSADLTAAFSAAVYERYETYIECLMRKNQAQPAAGLAVQAFEISELARARSLAELLQATQTNLAADVDPQLAAQEKSLRQSLRVKENEKVELLGKNYRRVDLASLENELAQLESQYKQTIETIRARYPAYDQISRPTGWHLQQIQEQVLADHDTLLLEYSLGRERSYVWAVTREGIRSYELPAQRRINEAAQKVYGLLTTSNPAQIENELDQAARELGQMVLSPLAAELNKRRLIVVADGALNYIPFQFLIVPPGGNEPLVANYEVINAPSASILGQLREETARRQARTKVLAAFGDPVFASNYAQHKETSASESVASAPSVENDRWQPAVRDIEPEGDSVNPETIRPLFYSKLELSNLRDVAGPDSLVATGFDATRERLAQADLSQYSILHFATHGILDPKRPERSGLFLSMVDREGKSQNGFVGLQDIYGLRAPVDLVVLSACRTGLGKDVRGEGLIGLTRGFMYAGASSVVASLWKVDDEATSELMKRFYTNMLRDGMTPAAALRAAQNSIRQQPQWRSPYFWAAFTLQGEYRHAIEHTPARSFAGPARIGIGLVVLLMLLSGVWWYRRAAGSKAVQPKPLT
jgi:CHAT domain-containing protein/tetratricopeptide (TPR) repeat protein